MRRTNSRRLRVMAAVAMAATLLPLAPASAGFDGSIRPPGNVGGGGSGQSGSTRCVDGAAVRASDGTFIYHAPASICDGVTTGTDGAYVGPVWFEVWRFYGTQTNPTQAWSVSRMNMPKWADQSELFAAFAPHPRDGNASGSLWRRSTQAPNGGAKVFRPDGWSASPGAVVRTGLVAAGQRAISTETPFRSSSRDCRAVMTAGQGADRKLRDAFNPSHPNYDDDNVVEIRKFFFDQFKGIRAEWGTQAALATLNLRGSRDRGAGAVPRGPNDIVYDDGVPCSSGYDFVVPAKATPKVFTTCWIPVDMQYRTRHVSGQQIKDFRVAAGARYHTRTYPKVGGADHPAQRGVIRADVLSRSNADPRTPAQPFTNASASYHPARNAGQAASAAANHASCVSGHGSVLNEVAGADEKGPQPSRVTIEITGGADDYAHVGGKLDDETFTAVYRGMDCRGGSCGGDRALRPKLVALDYTLRVRGTGGYTECRSTTSLACEYASDGPEQLRWRARGGSTAPPSRDVTGYFYRATEGNQRVRVEAANASATVRVYWRETHTSGSCTSQVFHVFGGTAATGGHQQPCRTWTTVEHKDVKVPVRVLGQRTLKVTSGVGRG